MENLTFRSENIQNLQISVIMWTFACAFHAFSVYWSSPITCSIRICLDIGMFLTENLSIPPLFPPLQSLPWPPLTSLPASLSLTSLPVFFKCPEPTESFCMFLDADTDSGAWVVFYVPHNWRKAIKCSIISDKHLTEWAVKITDHAMILTSFIFSRLCVCSHICGLMCAMPVSYTRNKVLL